MVPVTLTGNNLGERQKQLNSLINETKLWDASYDLTDGDADIDIIFKTDLASKFKKIDYLLSVLKAGDSLYISRILKYTWIYDIEYADYINPDYLHNEIFPYMSVNMKQKTLIAISMNVKENTRLVNFYNYCNNNKNDVALKFLVYMTENYKLDYIKDNYRKLINRPEYLKYLIGNSFTLAYAYLDNSPNRGHSFYLRHLYNVSESTYLDVLEKYENTYRNYYGETLGLGLRITKSIVKKHKNRLLEKPELYLKWLSLKAVLKYINEKDAKIISEALCPDNVKEFWSQKYYLKNKNIIDLIPFDSRLKFIKELFVKKYPGEEFEMAVGFFLGDLCNIMTKKERENWALKHLEKDDGFYGDTSDYTWYKFIEFDAALKRMKPLIHAEPDRYKRMKMLDILLEATSSHNDVENLLKYYYERHINEQKKELFVKKVIEKYNVYEFGDSCWSVLNKLFHAVQVYNKSLAHDSSVMEFRVTVLLYHIIHDISLPEILISFDCNELNISNIEMEFGRIKEKHEKVYEFLIQLIIREVTKYESKEMSQEIKDKLRPLLNKAIDLLEVFKKKIEEYPPVIMKFAELDRENFQKIFRNILVKKEQWNENELLRLLKKDVALVNHKIPLIEKREITMTRNSSRFVNKLKIYFCKDAAQEWLNHFTKTLDNCNNLSYTEINMASYAIFVLAGKDIKSDFMLKFLPKSEKIHHDTIDRNFLYVQKSICRFVAYSRPPMPLELIMSYVKGDYVHFCMPMFSMLSVHLPTPNCMSFVQLLLDTPISIQKHGIRLAFKSFSSSSLAKVVTKAWERTKNVSLRTILFLALYNRIPEETNETAKKELIELLKSLMMTIQQNDDDVVSNCFGGDNIPPCFRGDFLEFSWNIVDQLPDIPKNIKTKRIVIKCIRCNIDLMRDEYLYNMVAKLVEECLEKSIFSSVDYYDYIWDLIADYIVTNKTGDALEKKLSLLKIITTKLLEMWDETLNNTYVARRCFTNFVDQMEKEYLDLCLNRPETADINFMLEVILQDITSALPISEIYFIIWKIKLTIALQSVIKIYLKKYDGKIPTDIKTARDMGIDIGEVIGTLLKEFVDLKLFFSSCFSLLEEILQKSVYDIMFRFESSYLENKVYLALGLASVDVLESRILALNVLPSESPENSEDDFRLVLDRIKSVDNNELKCAIYHKFCSDYKRTKLF